MNCPVCKRELAPTLSICLTCGAMMNDTVREELETKIGRPEVPRVSKAELPKFEPVKPWTPQPVKVNQNVPAVALNQPAPERELSSMTTLVKTTVQEPIKLAAPALAPSVEPAKPNVVTAKLRKQTSPTLVDFQPTNPTIPDWRLQLQNSIRKRNLDPRSEPEVLAISEIAAVPAIPPIPAKPAPQTAVPGIQNEKLANAIKRIEASKRAFGSGAAVGMAAAAQARRRKPAVPQKSFPFDVVERKPNTEAAAVPVIPTIEMPKPKLVSPMPVQKKKFDTNKLPPIPEPETPLTVEAETEGIEEATEVRSKISFDRLRIWNTAPKEESKDEQELSEEIDDLAPFSMRFGASVFDLIIGSFAAGILLSPMLLSGSFGSTSGIFAIVGGWLFVVFAYFTGSIVYMGRTFGMKLFSIEMIDAEANELPTFHQAAVNSAAYLLSLMLLGLGFVPAFFNEERRAMHDILSGTLLIREY